MAAEWNFVIGAITGFSVSVIGYILNHVLRLREESIGREFEMRREGRDFYLPLYGFLADLNDLVSAYTRAVEKGKAQLLIEQGFKYLKPNEIVARYKKRYEKFTKFMATSREKGYELFLPLDLSYTLRDVWGLGDFLYEEGKWDKKLARDFDDSSTKAMNRLEELLGLKRKGWFRPREWFKT